MKNSEYKNHNRAIKEVKPGVWQCRLFSKKGERVVPSIIVDRPDMAWRWLRFETDLKFPDPGGFPRRDPKMFLPPKVFAHYAAKNYRLPL